MPRHQTVEDAAMPVGPIHHRGNGKSEVIDFAGFIGIINHFTVSVLYLLQLILIHFRLFSCSQYSNAVLKKLMLYHE
jgi:hypothetical protein